jgi:hypothetical protein
MARLRHGDWIAGAGGVALIASLFLHWYGAAVPDGFREVPGQIGALNLTIEATAWQAFDVLDVVLTLLALVPLALVGFQATRASPSIPVALSVFTILAGALAMLLILYRIVNQPGPNELVDVQRGAWLGLLAALVTTVGGWRSTRDESIPGVRMPPMERQPAP